MRRRNPDEQAYRAWQADRSDRESLQRYLSSMARDREILDDPERIVELDEAVGQNEALRPIYTRVRPDYSNAATPFEERRWRTLVDRYAGRQLDPRAVLILIEMGLRSGVYIIRIYELIYSKKILDYDIFKASSGIIVGGYVYRRDCYDYLDMIGPYDSIPSIPALIYVLRFMHDNPPDLMNALSTLGNIGQAAARYINLISHFINGQYDQNVTFCCRAAIEKITGEAPE